MKNVFLLLIILSMITVFSLAGCKAEAIKEVNEEKAVEEVTDELEEEALDESKEEEIVE